ncbi:hypothetical protein TOPH_03644 [Tolypocladium ophioglossoides CBS 100239]|uniref:Uncharacterized protein n=1 Tax=Tolypocladium ophioglossoides (strain CBS 100239) TaxID=1163406 RepID=A0A0L0NBY5_TOLOC|nr:hypothetical protein TOPH_03644 [Tolypocladium ophioglossoides CBS 100239]
MAATTDGSQNMSSRPLLWVIIPLLAVFSAGCFTAFVWTRHRRARRDPAWLGDRILMPSGFLMARPERRWNTTRARSVEGLNELGEAPPPYDTKKPPPIDGLRRDEVGGPAMELRDLEVGTGPPPGYVAPLPAAHVAPLSRRSV